MHLLLAFIRIAAEGGGASLFESLGINLVQLLAQIFNFLLLLYFLNGMLIRPILRNLEARRKRIDDSLENARLADERLAGADAQLQTQLREASAEVEALRARMLAGAQIEAQHIHAEAEAEAGRIKAQAHRDAQAEHNRLLADARQQIVSMVMAATHKLVGDSLDASRQQSLINDFFAQVSESDLSDMALDGTPVTVISALPLTVDEQARVKVDLSKVGTVAAIHFEVAPSILGGLIVRVGNKIIDGSVSGKMNALRQQLYG